MSSGPRALPTTHPALVAFRLHAAAEMAAKAGVPVKDAREWLEARDEAAWRVFCLRGAR